MKKLFQQLTCLVVFALVFGLSSCLSDNEINPDPTPGGDAERVISLRLMDEAGTMGTRGVSDPIPGAGPDSFISFNTGHLYFTNAWGAILYNFAIVDDPADPRITIGAHNEMTGAAIYAGALQNGVYIHSLRGQTTRVYVVANYVAGNSGAFGALPTIGNISTVKERILQIRSQYDARDPGINQFRGEDLVRRPGLPSPPTGNFIYEATVILEPTVARFEIASIAGTRLGTAAEPNTIVSFDIDGIFMDKFYHTATIGGAINTNLFFDGGMILTNFDGNSHSTAPVSDNLGGAAGGAVHDWFPTPLESSVPNRTVTAGGNYVFAYQVFARNPKQDTPVQTPRIILRLSNVVTSCCNGNNFPDPQFITVKGFTIVDGGGTLNYITAGNVYKIDVIEFNQTNLTPFPNMEDMAVNVEISLAHWNGHSVSPSARLQTPHPSNMYVPLGVTTEVLRLGDAWGGTIANCTNETIHYQWYWYIPATGWQLIAGQTNPDLQIPPLRMVYSPSPLIMPSRDFRRRAWRCTPTNYVISRAARVTAENPISQGELIGGAFCPLGRLGYHKSDLGAAMLTHPNHNSGNAMAIPDVRTDGTGGNSLNYRWEMSRNNYDWEPAFFLDNSQFSIPWENTIHNNRYYYILSLSLDIPKDRPMYFRRVASFNVGQVDGQTGSANTIGRVAYATNSVAVWWYPRTTSAVDIPLTVEIGGYTWATRNVDFSQNVTDPSRGLFAGFAAHPADAGMTFQWGLPHGWYSILHSTDNLANETSATRSWAPTRRWEGGVGGDWINVTWNTTAQTGDEWTVENDPCALIPGGNWRTPTRAQLEVLRGASNDVHVWANQNELSFGCQTGRVFGTTNVASFEGNNHLFFPAIQNVRTNNNGHVVYHGTSIMSAGTPRYGYWARNNGYAMNIGTAATTVSYVTPAHRVFAMPVRCVKVTPEPSPNAHVTALVNTMYDFQTQPLEAFFNSTTTPQRWQWQWSQTATNTNWTDIAGATGTTFTQAGDYWRAPWALPTNFIHNVVMPNPMTNRQGDLYFRAVITTANGNMYVPIAPLQIRFIQTTMSGNNDFLTGFGIHNGVRYARLARAPQAGPPVIGNFIYVALENLGADTDGVLGSMFQWGRRADGHQRIGWFNDPIMRHTTFTSGVSGTSGIAPVWVPITAQGQPVTPNQNFLTSTAGMGCWSAPAPVSGDPGSLLPASRDLWGAGTTYNAATEWSNPNSVTRATAPLHSGNWRTPENNPCPPGWRVPTQWELWDMANGDGADAPSNTAYGNRGNNREWTRRDTSSGAVGGAIVRNTSNNAVLFLPAAGMRTPSGTSADVAGTTRTGRYWSSTQHSGDAAGAFTLNTHSDNINVGGGMRFLGMSVRCVRN